MNHFVPLIDVSTEDIASAEVVDVEAVDGCSSGNPFVKCCFEQYMNNACLGSPGTAEDTLCNSTVHTPDNSMVSGVMSHNEVLTDCKGHCGCRWSA